MLLQERIKLLGEVRVEKERDEMNKLMMKSSSDKDKGGLGLEGLLAAFAGLVALVSILFAVRFL